MNEFLYFGLAGFGSLCALYALLYVGTAAISPRFFLDELSLSDERFKKSEYRPFYGPAFRWTHYLGSAALLIGLLVLTFHAANALTFWMPAGWIETDEEGGTRWVGYSAQFFLGFLLFAFVGTALGKLEDNAHRLIPPTRWRLSAGARRGYERANEMIDQSGGALSAELNLRPGPSVGEFLRGFNVRIAEEGNRDAKDGRYRPTAFGDNEAYVNAWSESVGRLRVSGWRHSQIEQAFEEIEAAREAEAKARDKEYWKAALGCDPDEVLR